MTDDNLSDIDGDGRVRGSESLSDSGGVSGRTVHQPRVEREVPEVAQAGDDSTGIDVFDVSVTVSVLEGRNEPNRMLFQRGLRICEKLEAATRDHDAFAQQVCHSGGNKIGSVDVAIEAILEAVLVLKSDAHEAMLVVVVPPHHSIRPLRDWAMKAHRSGSYC